MKALVNGKTVETTREAGANGFLGKPFRVEELSDAVRKVLSV